MTEAILFYVLAVLAVAGGAGVISAKRTMYSAMSLVWTLFCLSAIYVLLRAHLLAALQILIYAGAVMMLFVFVIMLLGQEDEEEKRLARKGAAAFFGILGAGVIFASVAWALTLEPVVEGARAVGGVREVAMQLFTEQLLAFQVVAVLLLSAITGATVIAIRRL